MSTRKSLSPLGLAGIALASAVVTFACTVNLPDTTIYSCTADKDCAGDGYKCAARPGGLGRCCKPTGPEVCNGLDDDCNGLVDDGFPPEPCNGKDDDCDGKIDNGFDLQNDPANCGACSHACQTNEFCSIGTCVKRGETDCADGIDNDDDGKTDCADPDCNLEPCGSRCECRGGVKSERNCTDGLDNDGDGKTDCADEDCAGAGCFDGGCTCLGLKPSETNCFDGVDDDGDGKTDCDDPDCANQFCKPTPSSFTCAGTSCLCNSGAGVTETGAVLCRDRIDNDCNGLTDCQEIACDGLSCALDGGSSCQCVAGTATEKDCADRQDDDNDGLTDCGDSLPDGGGDCPIGVACTYLQAGSVKNGACTADHLCK